MELKNDVAKVSYIIGQDIGQSFYREGYEIDIDILLEAIRQGSTGSQESLLSEEEKNEVMTRWQAEMQAKAQEKNRQAGLEQREIGEKFLSENREKEGIVETASGLQYKVITEGEGDKPSATDMVNVHYHGTLLNGDVFDSSVVRNEPVSFPLNQVIPGWTEGVQLMSVGSKYEFYIKADLAYGDMPVGNIPAGSTLKFEVELLGIEKA